MRQGLIAAGLLLAAVFASYGQSVTATPKTQAELLYGFRDGQAKNSITPRAIRDLIVSIPTIANVTISTSYAFSYTTTQTLSAGSPSTVTLSPCPLGVETSIPYDYYLRVSGGTGTPETVLVTGGTCEDGSASGTVAFTPANSHSGSWILGSATAGIQEAINVAYKAVAGVPFGGGAVSIARGTYNITGPIIVPNHVTVDGQHVLTTIIQAVSGDFPSNTAVINIDRPEGTGAYGSMVQNVWISCGNVAGSTGIYSDSVQEFSGVHNVQITECRSYGIHFTGNGAQNYAITNVAIGASASGASAVGIFLENTPSLNVIRHATINAYSLAQQNTAAIKLIGTNANIEDIHIESYDDGVLFSTNSTGGVNGVYGHSTMGNLVRIDSTWGVTVQNSFLNSGSVNIKDEYTSRTITSPHVSFYSIGVNANPTVITTDSSVGNYIKGDFQVGADFGVDGNLQAASAELLYDNVTPSGGSVLKASFSTGLLLQTNSMDGTFADGGLNLVGGGFDGDASRGGIYAGATSDLGTHTARGTTASGILFSGGGIDFYGDTGLTPGSSFSTTRRAFINPTGGMEVTGGFAAAGGSAGKATCWKADGKTLGYCSSAVDSSGNCTCN